MKQKIAGFVLLVLGTSLVFPPTALAGGETEKGEDVLVVRYACLVGGREGGTAPMSAGVLSREELSDFLLEWEPEIDNREVREVFALNDLGELSRQATQLPLNGGVVSGAYAHSDSSFEINMNIRPAKTIDSGEDVMTVFAEIKRKGELLSGPTIRTRLGERAIITTTNGPEAPFLFLVVEIDRLSVDEMTRRGLHNTWRKDYMLVDGEDVTAPVVIEKTQPLYTEIARQEKQQGRVVLRMVINEKGVTEDVEVVEGQPFGLTESAVAAAKTWRFEPALYEGKPVAVLYLITINFRLE